MKVKYILFICFLFLVFFAFSAADAVNFSRPEYAAMHGDFVKRMAGNLRRAGFEIDIGNFQEITEGSGRGISAGVNVRKYPGSLKKYFEEPAPQSFILQLLELDSAVVFSVKIIKNGKTTERFSFFKHVDKKALYSFDIESVIREAKAELVLALYGLDCQSRYGGSTKKNEEEDILILPVNNFSYDVDKFITLFFKELKYYGLRYAVVERFPVIEMRVFGFPPELSFLLPKPNSVFFMLENRTLGNLEQIFISRTDRYYENSLSVAIVIFNGREQLEKKAAETAKNIFFSLYVPSCPQYDQRM